MAEAKKKEALDAYAEERAAMDAVDAEDTADRLAKLEAENRAMRAELELSGKEVRGVPKIGSRVLVGLVRQGNDGPFHAVQIVADAEIYRNAFCTEADKRFLQRQMVPLELFRNTRGEIFEHAEDVPLVPWPGRAKTLKGHFFED